MLPSSKFTYQTQQLPSGNNFDLVPITGGSFMMGDDDSRHDDEKPAHLVNVPDFYLGKYPVTQELWEVVMGENPSRFKRASRPVEQVTWEDTQDFIDRLNKLLGIRSQSEGYRLPTEAEWEYAARGGKHSTGFAYSGSNRLNEVAWYNQNSHSETKPVGLKLPNELGLYDMSGNIWEWCADHWHDNYKGAPTDGRAWIGGNSTSRVVRGGSWYYDGYFCRVSIRNWYFPNGGNYIIGFRLARY